jgi:cytidylate kinase
MPIVTISRGTFSGGRMLAEELCGKLGCACTESEVLGDAARRLDVPVARLKAAMVKAQGVVRGFGRERAMYLAAITTELCERSLAGDLVYHGHAAHLLLPAVSEVVRVRVVADEQYRIHAAMQRTKLSWAEAKKYVRSVDLDRARWVDFLYGRDWTDPTNYDVVVNLEHLSVQNAAMVVLATAELPEFKRTPASLRMLQDILLASRARVRLGTDPRTSQAQFQVKAQRGTLTVKVMPRQASLVPLIPEVLAPLEGIQDLHCSIATTSILWMAEAFTTAPPSFGRVQEIAESWDAAVELVKLVPDDGSESSPRAEPEPSFAVESPALGEPQRVDNGGVLFDADLPPAPAEDPEMTATLDALRKAGRAGQARSLSAARVPAVLDPATKYSLVVIGDVFSDSAEGARARKRRELKAALTDHLGVPVVEMEELHHRLTVGPRQILGALFAVAVVAVTYFLVLTHQQAVMEFLTAHATMGHRILAVAVLALSVPLFAFTYGACIHTVARLLRFD